MQRNGNGCTYKKNEERVEENAEVDDKGSCQRSGFFIRE
jgi:hypothetical protein